MRRFLAMHYNFNRWFFKKTSIVLKIKTPAKISGSFKICRKILGIALRFFRFPILPQHQNRTSDKNRRIGADKNTDKQSQDKKVD